MFSQAALALFLVLNLRKKMRTLSPNSWWDKALTAMLCVIILLFITETSLNLVFITKWIWYLILLLLIGIIYKKQALYPSRTMLAAVAPVIFIFLVRDVIQALGNDLYEAAQRYLGFADAIAITWMIALLLISQRQQKALLKEREKRQAEEEQNKIIAARRAELEELVMERTAELTQQKEELQHALTNLKATQAQLVHREKMASLGELTAGIAHEIQNPLNFVNNFSELNMELTNELTHEITNLPASTEAKQNLIALLTDLQQNEQKIHDHGKRADGIVKNMLQHSRKTAGQKEPTDINALADEYLRLSYHGLRAKDKTFNATLKTAFDESIGNVPVVAQDMGRVFLNLFNNAFYTVHEKAKKLGDGYEPIVSVTTKKLNDKIEIVVKDNGMGISKSLVDKIFQPFFTTKPTGQGTGLGLSLAYEIIKAHGGELKVESEEGEGAMFIIRL